MCIEDYIPFGRDNAVTREYLKRVTELDDRTIRDEIKKARTKKYIAILNMQDGKGYYRPDENERADVERWLRQERHRMKEIRDGMSGAIAYLNKIDGQIELPNIP